MTQQPRVLLVEDEVTLLDLYKELLSREGFDIVSTTDGEQAYALILEGGYDLVLLDIMLPKMDGLQILQKLHEGAKPKLPNKSIVLLTNLAQEDVIEKGMSLGARGYLIKSNYNPAEFIQEVKNFLSNNP